MCLTLSRRRSLSCRNHWFSSANQWTGFYMIGTSAMKELSVSSKLSIISRIFFHGFLYRPNSRNKDWEKELRTVPESLWKKWSNLCAFIVLLFTLIDSIIWLEMERFNSCGVSARQLLHTVKSALLNNLGIEFCCFELVTKCKSIFYFGPFIPNLNQDLTDI